MTFAVREYNMGYMAGAKRQEVDSQRSGTLPGYASERSVRSRRTIGLRRPLSVSEEADLLVTGLTRRQASRMSPKSLRELAEAAVNQSDIFLGS